MRGPFTTKTITIMAESSSPWEARERAFDGWRRCLRLAGDMIRVPRSDRNATWLAHFFIVPVDACLLSEIWCAVYASTQMTRTNAQSPGLAMPRPAWPSGISSSRSSPGCATTSRAPGQPEVSLDAGRGTTRRGGSRRIPDRRQSRPGQEGISAFTAVPSRLTLHNVHYRH